MEEIWTAVVGYEGFYEVSDIGNVRSLYREWIDTWGRRGHRPGIILKQQINEWGYPIVKLYGGSGKKRSTVVSHLVMRAFVGPRPKGMEVCHNDGKPGNSVLTNLRYDTPSGSAADRVAHGTHNRGERNWTAKLCEDDVMQIRMMEGMGPHWAIAAAFGVSDPQISFIRNFKTWKHIDASRY